METKDLIACEGVKRMTFGDERIADVREGRAHLTPAEREFLEQDTPTFEECDRTEAELKVLPDSDLMEVAYWTWHEYARNQGL